MAKLIMIDDNAMEHLIMKKTFQKSAIFSDAIYSLDGRRIISWLEQHTKDKDALPDIIFLDLNMPEYSGWDFLDAFKLIYSQFIKPIHLYIVSSSVDTNDHLRAKQYDFVNSFLTKPASKDVLVGIAANQKKMRSANYIRPYTS